MLLALVHVLPILLLNFSGPNDHGLSARIEVCNRSWLNQLAEVKQFVSTDARSFYNLETISVSKDVPYVVLLDSNRVEVERIDVSGKTRQDISELLLSRGIQKKLSVKRSLYAFLSNLWIGSKCNV